MRRALMLIAVMSVVAAGCADDDAATTTTSVPPASLSRNDWRARTAGTSGTHDDSFGDHDASPASDDHRGA